MKTPAPLRKTLPALLLLASLAGLSGCAAYRIGAASLSGVASGPVPPTELITEQLIDADKVLRARRSSQSLAHLVVRNPPPYTIGSGDILSIVVWDHPELAGQGVAASATLADTQGAGAPPAGFVVDHEGRVQFPFAGPLTLAGLTEEQARALLTSRLAHYITRPLVTLRVQAHRSKRVYIDGEVRLPGLQSIDDIPMTLVEALNRAGGMLPSADQSRIVLERGDARYQVGLRALVARGINPGSILLEAGDVVRVHSRDESKVFVSGEVIAPKALTMHDGRLTLNEALGESGGISPLSGDARQVYVVRRAPEGTRVYQLDARRAGALAMAEAFELEPRDLVYVAASPLANWYRSVSMLFPGALTQVVTLSRP
jgi:polysaccharide export outer membrane protein